LPPAERLWLLTTTMVNRQYATIEDLEDAQFARRLALQQRPDLIRSTTRFHWWPQQIHKRRGPRRGEYHPFPRTYVQSRAPVVSE